MKRMITFLRRAVRGIPPPAEWMLEVTNRCNLACPMCLRDKAEFLPRDMDFRFIHLLLERNPQPVAIWPYGYGEPLMYPRIFDFIRYAKEKGIVVSLSTNATFLDKNRAEKLLNSGLDYLIIAFDGATPSTYEKYRKGANFRDVKANVERFLSLKVARRSQLHLTLQMILMRENANETAAFARLWERTGVDSIRIREDLLKMDKTDRNGRTQRRPCFFLWRGPLFIQAAGTTIPCPYYHGSEPFGDLRSQTTGEAWNSARMVALRQAHISGDLSGFPVCARCPRYQPHPILACGGFFVTTGVARKYLPHAEHVQRTLGWKLFE